MTQDETRKLGIEFERRLNTMHPGNLYEKIDTDTIYSILSEYQIKYIKQILFNADQISGDNRISSRISDIVKSITKHAIIPWNAEDEDLNDAGWKTGTGDVCCRTYELPEDYFYYIRSSCITSMTYKTYPRVDSDKFYYLTNKLIREDDVDKILEKPYNEGAIIRNPLVVLENDGKDIMKVFTDRYTGNPSIDLTYCQLPFAFNVLNYNDEDNSQGAVHSYCSLPMSCFDDLVNGAVMLYMTYKTNVDLTKSDATKQALKNLTSNNQDNKQ